MHVILGAADNTTTGFNNFSGTDTPLFEQFAITSLALAAGDRNMLKRGIEGAHKIDIIVSAPGSLNEVVEVTNETGYDGSLILFGGVTAGAIRDDLVLPPTLTSAILTAGGTSGPIMAKADYNLMVASVKTLAYVNTLDSDLPRSVAQVSTRRCNRAHGFDQPYLLEMLRALKFSQDESKDWQGLLSNKLSYDSSILVDPWP